MGATLAELHAASKKTDAFFTRPEVARRCWGIVQSYMDEEGIDSDLLFVEPSAGAGAFLDVLPPTRLGMDIEPRRDDIVKQDFLQWQPAIGAWCAVGNPPFGRQGARASQFIAHALWRGAEFAAFILPAVMSTCCGQRRVASCFGVAREVQLGAKGLFQYPDGRDYATGKCVFQIWALGHKRATKAETTHPDFQMKGTSAEVVPEDGWGLFIHGERRKGCAERPGAITPGRGKYIRGTRIYAKPEVIERLAAIDWEAHQAKDRTQVSHLTRATIVALYKAATEPA